MPSAQFTQSVARETPSTLLRGFLFVSIVACALGILALSQTRNINWDEFKYLSHLYEYQRGELTDTFQVGHVYVFGWLIDSGELEVDQVLFARIVYFAFLLITSCCLYGLARRFGSHDGACVAALAFLACSNVILHGTAFRVDGLSVLLLMLSLVCLFYGKPTFRSFSLAGILVGAAAFVTIKTALYALLFAPLLFVGPGRRPASTRQRLMFGTALVGTAFASFLGLIALHSLLTIGPESAAQGPLANAASTTVLSAGFLPQARSLVRTVLYDPLMWALLASGLVYAVIQCRHSEERRQALQRLTLSAPLLTLFFYRNSFPYYFVFILPPALVLIAPVYDRLASRRKYGNIYRWAVPILLLVSAIAAHSRLVDDTVSKQRVLLAGIREVFPEPTEHINGVSFVAAYPKVGFFMSSWGMANYRKAGEAIFPRLIRDHQPVFLVADVPHLEVFPTEYGSRRMSSASLLLKGDRAFLREQYIHHWGPLYVAGTHIDLTDRTRSDWIPAISGIYTLEAQEAVYVNGTICRPNTTVFLKANEKYTFSGGSQRVTLRWGIRLAKPLTSAPNPPIFEGL